MSNVIQYQQKTIGLNIKTVRIFTHKKESTSEMSYPKTAFKRRKKNLSTNCSIFLILTKKKIDITTLLNGPP